MNEPTNYETKTEEQTPTVTPIMGKPNYSRTFKEERPAIQVALFVLWRIYNKKYIVGTRLFATEIAGKLKTTKANYRDALLFLEGAGAVVNEVVITNTVSKELIDRYGLIHE